MSTVLEIVKYAVSGLAVLVAIAGFLYGKLKGSNSKFITKLLGFLTELESSVSYAEQMTKLSGEEKKEFATQIISLYCENKGIPVTDEQLSKAIDALIAVTNVVNAKDEDTEDELNGNLADDCAIIANDESASDSGEIA